MVPGPLGRIAPILLVAVVIAAGHGTAASWSAPAAEPLAAPPGSPLEALGLAWQLAGRDGAPHSGAAPASGPAPALEPAYAALATAAGQRAGPSGLGLDGTPLEPILARLLQTLADATTEREAVLDALPADDRDTLDRLDAAYRASRTAGTRAPLEDAVRATGGLPGALDAARLDAAAARLAQAGLDAGRQIAALGPADWPAIDAALPGCVQDPIPLVVVCGRDDDTVNGIFALELDLGGDDVHRTNAGGSGLGVVFPGPNGLPAALSLDVMGNDHYVGGSQVQGSGTGSPGILLDLEGHDTYSATSGFFTFAHGAGHLGGTGLLYDALGDDAYVAGGGWDTQGFGILGGAGVLLDDTGNEVYRGGTFAQGTGDFHAAGLLVDTLGWDTYSAGRWSQGFGDGAGVGWLWDADGHDEYLAGQQAQGAGFGGNGLLVDGTGNDRYSAAAQSQGWGGAGPALKPINDVLVLLGLQVPGTGVLIDGSGDDTYSGPGCDLCAWTGGSGGAGFDGL